MARRGGKKKKSNYSDKRRQVNKQKKLSKHLSIHSNDSDAQKALKAVK